jgi:hypothetical protein
MTDFYKSGCESCISDLVDKMCLNRAVYWALPGTYKNDTKCR